MRLVTMKYGGDRRVGVLKGDGVVGLTKRLRIYSPRTLFARGLLDRAREIWETSDIDTDFTRVELDLPVADPPRIFCIGVNYLNRNEEYKDGSAPPEYPSIFMRGPQSFVPHGHALIRPRESRQLDYEGEIVLVIGKAGRRISETDAMAHVGGLTIMNEGSVRDWIRHGKFNVTQGKNWDRSGGLGPWIETDLSGLDMTNLKIETRVNGEVRQSDTTASMAFPFAKIINYVSTFTELQPGDLIATGTPTGAGARFDPPRWLTPGDEVEVEVEGVGVLRNTVADE